VRAIFGMDRLLIRGWVLFQALTGTAGDGFVGPVDADDLFGFGIQDPEDLLDVVSHLPEVVLGGNESARGLAMFAFQMHEESPMHEDDYRYRRNQNQENEWGGDL